MQMNTTGESDQFSTATPQSNVHSYTPGCLKMTITQALLTVLAKHGFGEEYLRTNLIGACSDGASTMLGCRTGILTRLSAVPLGSAVPLHVPQNWRFSKGPDRNKRHADFHG